MKKNKNSLSIKISPEFVGLRLDKALGTIKEIGSRSRAESLLKEQLVLCNGKPAKASHKISALDRLEVFLPESVTKDLQPLSLTLDILYEDTDLLVINKPPGLVVHPAAGHANDTLVNALIHHTGDLSMKFGEARPGIVHRLDRDTSGLLVVAKNDLAHERLARQFKERTIHRLYWAACIGVPSQESGTLQSFLARHPAHRKKFASVLGVDKKILRQQTLVPKVGKWSVTTYKTLKKVSSGLCLLELKLGTGRTHQIRVHLSEIGLPIVGDDLYGASRKIKSIKSASARNLTSEFPRFALHAAELGFTHPTTGEGLSFHVPWPEDLAPLLRKLELL